MKEHLHEIVSSTSSPLDAINRMREYLQARILGSLQHAGAMIPLAFQGGTALRFLFSLKRYSEDMDFTLEGNSHMYDLKAYLKAIQSDLAREAYEVNVKLNQKRTVHSAYVRFPGLLQELKLVAHPAQLFSVRLEIDTNPPAGAILETSVVRRHVLLRIQHHDKASLFAGKVHALLQREYLKGRDVYDLLWYLSDPEWPEPNLTLLNNALKQTGWKSALTSRNWKSAVRRKLAERSWKDVVRDVSPFLESKDETALLTPENLYRLL